MSWIDREIKKRKAAARHSKMPDVSSPPVNESEQMAALWNKLEAANGSLPAAIRLQVDSDLPMPSESDVPWFRTWLRAPNGAGLGFTGDAVRYVWPERALRASHNFWVHWKRDRGFVLARRVVSRFTGTKIVESRFDDSRAAYLIKCLVIGRRVKPSAMRKRRLGLF